MPSGAARLFPRAVGAYTDEAGPEQRKLLKAVTEFGGYYIRANASGIPNYGERYRQGEAISSAFVESAVNQIVSKRMVKKQQMRWTPRGAHLLLQVRTRVLNNELAEVFHRWPARPRGARPAAAPGLPLRLDRRRSRGRRRPGNSRPWEMRT